MAQSGPTDPTDDSIYQNLRLEDFLRHFVPQALRQQEEMKALNEKGFAPIYDPLLFNQPPPNVEPLPPPKNRAERRQREREQKKKR